MRVSWPSTRAEYRRHALSGTAPDGADLTVLTYGALRLPQSGGWGTGVLGGNANLFADVQPGFGYVAVGHDGWSVRSCIARYGDYHPAPDCADRLLATVPGTTQTWLDAMTSDTVLLDVTAPAPIRAAFRSDDWLSSGRVGPYTRHVRVEPRPDRVAATRGDVASVAATGPTGRPAYAGEVMSSYAVSTGAAGGDLVLRVPWWPGLEATVAGQPVEVQSIESMLTVVPLPGGLTDAPVTVSYRPRGEDLLVPLLTLGGLMVLLAAVAGEPLRRARRSEPSAP